MKKALKVLGIIGASFIAFIIFVSFLAVTLGDDEDTPDTTASAPAEAEAPEEKAEAPKEEEVKPVGIGEQLTVGDIVFTVNERSKATNVGGDYGVSSKGEFLILNVSVENKGSEAFTIDSSFFKLLADGKTYESDSSAGVYANEELNFFYEEINPDLTLQGNIVFDIAPEMHGKELTLQVETSIFGFGSEKGTIVLQ